MKKILEKISYCIGELTTVDPPDIRLEEYSYNKKIKTWEVVVSFLVENTNQDENLLNFMNPGFKYHRTYKQFKLNDQLEVLGMFIYNKM